MQGKTINGFILQKPLGIGGMAEVWYAENEIHKAAAVKMLNVELSHNEQIVERFRTEAEIMVKLNHPNIRQVYGYGSIDGRPAIVMEYLEGDDLKARLKHGQRFTDEELKNWWNQLVSALNYTHKKGIVHRDIKPGNIFVDTEGNIKLLDFGIAKVRESISATQTGQKLGTLMYMSPEQVRDSKHVDYRTDVYSLAVTFVNLLTGKKPYDSDTSSDFDISEQIVYHPLDLSGVPGDWAAFLSPYLEKDFQKRPALKNFEAVKSYAAPQADEDDGTIVEGASKPQAKPVTNLQANGQKPAESEKPKGKKKWPWLVALGIVAVVGVLLGFIFSTQSSTNSIQPSNEITNDRTEMNIKGEVTRLVERSYYVFDDNPDQQAINGGLFDDAFFLSVVYGNEYLASAFYKKWFLFQVSDCEMQFDNYGNISLIKSIWENGGQVRFSYDENQRVMEIDARSENVNQDEGFFYCAYVLNGDGAQIISETQSKETGSGEEVYTIKYQYNAQRELTNSVMEHDGTAIYFDYTNGRLTHMSWDDSWEGDGSYHLEFNVAYNSNGEIESVNVTNEIIEQEYRYLRVATTTFEYQYDSYNNWINRIGHAVVKVGDEEMNITIKTTRTYYYDTDIVVENTQQNQWDELEEEYAQWDALTDEAKVELNLRANFILYGDEASMAKLTTEQKARFDNFANLYLDEQKDLILELLQSARK